MIFVNYFKRIGWKRVLVMFLGNVFLGMGVSIFKYAQLGNDAYDAMVMALADCAGIEFGHFFALFSLGFFVLQLFIGRKYIGIGTVTNCFLLGYIVSFFYRIWTSFGETPDHLLIQLIIMVVGVVLTGMGLSMYQKPDVGTSPYDSLSLILAEKIKKVPYFWWRMLTDAICVLVAFLAGGLIGIGVLAAAFLLGPFVAFFDRHLTEKLLS